MKYAYSNDGLSFRMVDDDYIAQSGEVMFSGIPTSGQLASAFTKFTASEANLVIVRQIVTLEAQQTPRRMREALAGTDGGWLAALNTQITTLRAQLTH